jgi:hypothetical protein
MLLSPLGGQENEWDILLALLEANRQREKTAEQKLREVAARKEALEHVRPRGRPPQSNPRLDSFASVTNGQRVDALRRQSLAMAAQEQGLSRSYAAEGFRVLEVIDQLEADGH